MNNKVLAVDPKKCIGCGLCQIACSINRCGVSNPTLSCIRVVNWMMKAAFLPVSCQQCEDAPCMAVCPKDAIYRDSDMDRVMVDYHRCVSCKMCVAACPFGAMGFDDNLRKVFKCDLCGGQPQCVEFCTPNSLSFVDSKMVPYSTSRDSARMVLDFSRNAQIGRE